MVGKRFMVVVAGSLIAALAIVWMIGGSVAVAGSSGKELAVVHRGVTAGKHWVVAAVDRRPHGVCLYIAIVYPRGGGYLCGRPRKSNGIVEVSPFGRAAHGDAKMTLISGAFDPAVRTVRLTLDDGSVMNVHPRPIHADRAMPRIRTYRYVAKAVRGSVCASQMETVEAGGRVLWDAPEWELKRLGLLCRP